MTKGVFTLKHPVLVAIRIVELGKFYELKVCNRSRMIGSTCQDVHVLLRICTKYQIPIEYVK